MNRVWTRLTLVLTCAVLVAACEGGDEGDERADRCEVPLVVPDGFEVTGGIEDPQSDRTGVRIDLADGDGAELHFFSGIRGEFGEGLPAHGEIELRGGHTGVLIGRETTWLVEWSTAPPCTPTVVLANGVDRHRFRKLLGEAGALGESASEASGTA